MLLPHGGKLVQCLECSHPEVDEKSVVVDINSEEYTNLENIATGIYSPLDGYMDEQNYQSVLTRGRLKNDVAWTIPILMHLDKEVINKLEPGELAFFRYESNIVGNIRISDVFSIEPGGYAENVYGTVDKNHPGVAKIFSKSPHVIGGKICLYKRPVYPVFSDYHLTPKETRLLFKERGWKKVVAFQTRNVPHIGHEYVQKTALSTMDGLFINPLMGKKKKGDFKDEVILNSYKVLLDQYYPKDRTVMSVLTCPMHYAGPREAIFHAIMRQNYGCTHFIVGRDHAGVGNYYGPFDAHKIFDRYQDLKIEPVFFKSFFKCNKCDAIANDKTCDHSEEYIVNFAGTQIRKTLVEGDRPSSDVMRPEVADEILKYDNPFVE